MKKRRHFDKEKLQDLLPAGVYIGIKARLIALI